MGAPVKIGKIHDFQPMSCCILAMVQDRDHFWWNHEFGLCWCSLTSTAKVLMCPAICAPLYIASLLQSAATP